MANYTKFTLKKEQEFCDIIAMTGVVTEACRAIGVSRVGAYKHAEASEAFEEAWDDARAQYVERLEKEADRRAVEGTEKPVFYKGDECGRILEYSDTLLIFRLKALDPEKYRERSEQKTINDPIDWDRVPVDIQDKFLDGKMTLDAVRIYLARNR